MKTLKYKKQILKIIKSDFRNAGVYSEGRNCLLATAAKRQGFEVVSCGPETLTTSIGHFRISNRDENRIFCSYPPHPNPTIADIDGRAKPRLDVKPFSVTLIPA